MPRIDDKRAEMRAVKFSDLDYNIPFTTVHDRSRFLVKVRRDGDGLQRDVAIDLATGRVLDPRFDAEWFGDVITPKAKWVFRTRRRQFQDLVPGDVFGDDYGSQWMKTEDEGSSNAYNAYCIDGPSYGAQLHIAHTTTVETMDATLEVS